MLVLAHLASQDEFGRVATRISAHQHELNRAYLQQHVVEYFELPPVYDACAQANQGCDHDASDSSRCSLLSKAQAEALFVAPGHAWRDDEFISFYPPFIKLVPQSSHNLTMLRKTTAAKRGVVGSWLPTRAH